MALILDLVKTEFAKRAAQNPRYSLRAFARSLGLHSGTLSQLLSGTRPLSMPTATKLLDALSVTGSERQTAILSVIDGGVPAEEGPSRRVLKDAEIAIIADWQHYALLSLLDTRQVNRTTGGLAKRLGISTACAMESLERLALVGLVEQREGQWYSTGQTLTTREDFPSSALRAANRSNIEQALLALEECPVEERDISGITFAGDKKNLAKAKELLRKFRRQLAELMESDSATEVYRLNIQLVPLTKKGRS